MASLSHNKIKKNRKRKLIPYPVHFILRTIGIVMSLVFYRLAEAISKDQLYIPRIIHTVVIGEYVLY